MTTKDVAQLIAEATTDAEVCGDLVIVAAQLWDCVARLQAAHAARRALVELRCV